MTGAGGGGRGARGRRLASGRLRGQRPGRPGCLTGVEAAPTPRGTPAKGQRGPACGDDGRAAQPAGPRPARRAQPIQLSGRSSGSGGALPRLRGCNARRASPVGCRAPAAHARRQLSRLRLPHPQPALRRPPAWRRAPWPASCGPLSLARCAPLPQLHHRPRRCASPHARSLRPFPSPRPSSTTPRSAPAAVSRWRSSRCGGRGGGARVLLLLICRAKALPPGPALRRRCRQATAVCGAGAAWLCPRSYVLPAQRSMAVGGGCTLAAGDQQAHRLGAARQAAARAAWQ